MLRTILLRQRHAEWPYLGVGAALPFGSILTHVPFSSNSRRLHKKDLQEFEARLLRTWIRRVQALDLVENLNSFATYSRVWAAWSFARSIIITKDKDWIVVNDRWMEEAAMIQIF